MMQWFQGTRNDVDLRKLCTVLASTNVGIRRCRIVFYL